jgi:hypothetical protein
MTLDLTEDELNLLISSISIALNLMAESQMTYQMDQLLALQRKLMAVRDKIASLKTGK